MSFKNITTATVLSALLYGAATSSKAVADVAYPRIVRGEQTNGYPATGALLMYASSGPDDLIGLCSGTLIGCRTFLTAAHCVCPDGAYDAASCLHRGTTDPRTLRVYLQHGGLFGVQGVAISPAYNFAESGDVAVITLSEPVQGVTPAAINVQQRAEPGMAGTIVGFGTTTAARRSADDAGIKRQGKIVSAVCDNGIPDATHLCWNFANAGSNTCEGDSGGPLLMDVGTGEVVAGVTSGGNSYDCLAPDAGFDSDVYVNRAWIVATAGADLGTSCALPGVGATPTIFETTGSLDSRTTVAAAQIEVTPGTKLLRFGLNAQLGSASSTGDTNDFDLYVRAGSAPTTTAFDCAVTDATPFGVCSIESPASGPWYVNIRRKTGDGVFQLTTTAFTADAGSACAGDCNADGAVTVDEVLEGVRIALGSDDVRACPAFNVSSDGVVTVAEVLVAVSSALNGCPLL
jgi:hypothetical protein